jgi:hypothetical protein
LNEDEITAAVERLATVHSPTAAEQRAFEHWRHARDAQGDEAAEPAREVLGRLIRRNLGERCPPATR